MERQEKFLECKENPCPGKEKKVEQGKTKNTISLADCTDNEKDHRKREEWSKGYECILERSFSLPKFVQKEKKWEDCGVGF